MRKEDLIIGVHGFEGLKYGQYDVLSSFSEGLLKAFRNIGVKAYWSAECFQNNILPTFTIGFNVVQNEIWEPILNSNITNIMWSVDSIYAVNNPVMEKYSKFNNFVLFTVSNCDIEPLKHFSPSLNSAYLAHAVDPDLWKKPNDDEKEIDIILLSSVIDYKEMLNELRQQVPKHVFDIMMVMYDVLMKNPQLLFYDVYKQFEAKGLLRLNGPQYATFFYKLAYIVMYAKKVQVVENLSDYNLKIYGNGPWENIIKGKTSYCGPCNLAESINLLNKSKIVLHPHSLTLELGFHERILNASAIEAFTLSSDSKYIRESFKDSVGYYNNSNFEDLHEKVDYYLKNDDVRTSMAKKAREIVLKEHTWEVRAEQILNILGCNDGVEAAQAVANK